MPLSRIQPERYEELLCAKQERVGALLAPFEPPRPEVFRSRPLGFRMRAEFRMWHQGDALDYVMFDPAEPRDPVPVDTLPIACDPIRELMPPLRARLRADPALRRRLFQVDFLSSLAGDTLVTLVYHRPLDADWERSAAELAGDFGISVVGRSRGQKLVLGRDYVEEVLPVDGRRFRYRHYEQSFTQPNAGVNIRMIEWACRQARGLGGDLLELYCGNGNFTLPLARHFDQVIATELSRTATRAACENRAANGVDNLQIVRLAAREVSAAMRGERAFRRLAALPRPLGDYRLNTLLVDPPRAGLDPDTLALAETFGTVLYISCNPVTLAENLQRLSPTHAVSALALFDQFPYTDHMECGMLLRRKA